MDSRLWNPQGKLSKLYKEEKINNFFYYLNELLNEVFKFFKGCIGRELESKSWLAFEDTIKEYIENVFEAIEVNDALSFNINLRHIAREMCQHVERNYSVELHEECTTNLVRLLKNVQ